MGQTASPGATPISGRGGADVGAALAEPTASMVAPSPAEVTEAEDRIPPVKVIVTAPSQDQPGAVVVAPEGVVQSAPPGAYVDPPVALEAAQTEEGLAGGSSSAAVVPHRVRREPPRPLCREEAAPLRGGAAAPVDGRSGPDVGSFLAR